MRDVARHTRRATGRDTGMLIYGHRGASASEPENTLRAFRRALEMGVEGMEFDVQVTSDRVPVILHDRDVSRTTNGYGSIDHISFEDVRRLDAGHGERIPTFAEVLSLVDDRVHLAIEIKQSGIEQEVLNVLDEFPKARWGISSFDWTSLERLRTLSDTAEIWLLGVVVSDAMMNTAKRLKATGISLYAPAYNALTAPLLRDAGLDVIIWTVNDVEEAARVRALGAKGLCTDFPDLIMAGLSVPA